MTEIVTRAFTADLELDGDGRTIVGRCVPYDMPTLVADEDNPAPYMETWRRGAFRNAVKDPPRVLFNYMHQTSVLDTLGRAASFTETDSGLDGVFRVSATRAGDHALELVRDGTYRGLSIHAAVIRSRHTPDGVVERHHARLLHVALVDQPAYTDAVVTAVRSSTVTAASIVEIRALQDELRLRFPVTRG